MESTTSVTISNTPPESPASDFNFLRQEGTKYIRQLAGNSWTDHNIHDPGITILDQLCYAITDLSYRIDYDIKDLLARETGDAYRDLFSPAQILTVNPVTISDIRKVVIDVEGVKNAWVEKVAEPEPVIYYHRETKILSFSPDEAAEAVHLKGLYRVFIEEDGRNRNLSGPVKDIAANVKARLNNCRNVCEDFYEITTLGIQDIIVSGNVEVGPVTDINSLAANIMFRLANFISPRIRFYTLEELIKKGKTTAEIFEGPALMHGFIDDEELSSYDRKSELHVSDIIREMMDEPGVVGVNEITASAGTAQDWRLVLDRDKAPRLDGNTLASLKFFRNGVRVMVDPGKVKGLLTEMEAAVFYPELNRKDRDMIIPPGVARNIQAYYSIQHQFPEVFGIGDAGLPGSASSHRVAQARQLKAYLLIFEQILANYFAQVTHMKDLFSFDSSLSTYFCQSLMKSVPGAEELVTKDTAEFDKKIALVTESPDIASQRKNRFLDHLLARFNEDIIDYSLSGYEQFESPDNLPHTLARTKMNFLRNYPLVSNDRCKAFNYTVDSWDTGNISGLEKRIAVKTGIGNYTRRFLAGKREEGFHMIEHILLRPGPQDFSISPPPPPPPKLINAFEPGDTGYIRCLSVKHGLLAGDRIRISGAGIYDGDYSAEWVSADSFQIKTMLSLPAPGVNAAGLTGYWVRIEPVTKFMNLSQGGYTGKDPYSLQITFVFPGDVQRFAGENTRTFIENVIREETPVHITPYIRWLNDAELEVFEAAYKNFLHQLILSERYGK